VADAAGLNFNAHLPAAGLRNGTLDDFKISTGLADLDGFHGGSSCSFRRNFIKAWLRIIERMIM
jgi:hypothetical protein